MLWVPHTRSTAISGWTVADDFSHWNDHVIFSTPDGTDPTTNGRTYTITSPTTVQLQLQLLLTGILALANAAFLMLFWEGVILGLRKRGALLIAVLGVSLILVTGLAAFGFFGTSIVARAGPPKDAALVTQTVLHAVLGCLTSIGIWAAGAGISRLTARNSDSDLARVLIPAFPIGMAVLAALLIIALTAPWGRLYRVRPVAGLPLPSLALASAGPAEFAPPSKLRSASLLSPSRSAYGWLCYGMGRRTGCQERRRET